MSGEFFISTLALILILISSGLNTLLGAMLCLDKFSLGNTTPLVIILFCNPQFPIGIYTLLDNVVSVLTWYNVIFESK